MNDAIVKALQFLAEYELEQRQKASSWANMGSHASAHIRTPVAEAANNRANAIASVIADLSAVEQSTRSAGSAEQAPANNK